MIFQNEKTPFKAIKLRISKSQKIDTFPKGLVHPWFWSKNSHFSNFFFKAIQPRKMSSIIFQNEKTHFQAIKKKKNSKSRKIHIFPKGLTHRFGPKKAIFPTSFFQAIQAINMSPMIFQNEKTPFKTMKTRSLKSQKIDTFPKGLTHGFVPKMTIFPTSFSFSQYRPGKCLL